MGRHATQATQFQGGTLLVCVPDTYAPILPFIPHSCGARQEYCSVLLAASSMDFRGTG